MTTAEPLAFLGNPSSPYTRKMLALLRYRRIEHRVIWGSHMARNEGLAQPKVKLLPTFYFPTPDGCVEAVTDSTPIAQRLERDFAGRHASPADPELAYYAALIEDYADEWLSRPMFHYRWHHQADRQHAAQFLAHLFNPRLDGEAAQDTAQAFSKRQFDRLHVVGSSDLTAAAIEASYRRFIDLFDSLLESSDFVLGSRPCIADFAIYGQMTQLGLVDPTPRAIMLERSVRLESWLWRIEDLSGLEPDDADWASPTGARTSLAPLLQEVGRTYCPVMVANAAAVNAGEAQFSVDIDGTAWTQPTFLYQAKCLAALRSQFSELPGTAKGHVADTLIANGCAPLTEEHA